MTAQVLRFALCIAAMTTPSQDRDRLSPTNLLEFHQTDGAVELVETEADWKLRRAEIVQGMHTIMGQLPGSERRVPLDVHQIEEADCGTYVRRLITYQTEPDSRVTAYLCIPKDIIGGKGTAAAVLCLHPTDSKYGHQVVVGLNGKTGRQYAAELSERGYVTLSPSYPLMADYWPNLALLGYESGTMKAIWDNVRGLDLLESMPEVNAEAGFGVIGHSLGGHNAIFTAVLDQRISVVVSSCGFDSFSDYYEGQIENWFYGKGWCQARYMPQLSDFREDLTRIPFDFHELLGALAPRPVFINAPLHDTNFRWQSVDSCITAAKPIYKLLGAEENLWVEHPDSGHSFPKPMRQKAYERIDSVLHENCQAANSDEDGFGTKSTKRPSSHEPRAAPRKVH